MELIYKTKNADGNDIVKTVVTKTYPVNKKNFICRICGKNNKEGVDIYKIVSSNFTDWQYVGEYACELCAAMFSLYFYSYIQDKNEIRLLNIREMAEEIQKPQRAPFKIVISISQKKHLFYKAVTNQNSDNFIVNLEEEQIYCNRYKLRDLFIFVENLQALGESKKNISNGIIKCEILMQIGLKGLQYLHTELKGRQIHIVLYLSQKPNISKEEALCNLDLVLNH